MRSGPQSIILVGNPDPVHVGAHLLGAASELEIPAHLCDSSSAFAGNCLRRRFNWWLRGRRPGHLRKFSARVVEACRVSKPRFMLATGIAPVDADALTEIGRLGVTRLNYLTDDPWNPSHMSRWFQKALLCYDRVFSTRTSNIGDLERHGCHAVTYLPFAYDPAIHRYEAPYGPDEERQFDGDVAFAGGADADRIPVFRSLLEQRFNVALYGGYWNRHRETAAAARGHADAMTVRKAVAGAKVALCLVRRANRDGSSMRTFELAAMGACMLVEYTNEHEMILGPDGDAVAYFRSNEEMITKLRWLLSREEERARLRAAVRARIASGGNTYRDRLATLLAVAAS